MHVVVYQPHNVYHLPCMMDYFWLPWKHNLSYQIKLSSILPDEITNIYRMFSDISLSG